MSALVPFLFFLAALALAIGCIVIQAKQIKKKDAEIEALQVSINVIKEKAERLQKTLAEKEKIKEAADAERNELTKSPDAALIYRANGLF